jgi:hypothetical protein
VYAGNAVIAVVSDHGFHPTSRAVGFGAALREAGFIRLDESDRVVSWTASAWAAGSSAAIVLSDPGDGAMVHRVGALLDSLRALPDHGIDRVLGASELDERGGFPGASFLVSLAPGFSTGAHLTGPVVVPSLPLGMHGHLPDDPALHAAFFARGRGVTPRALGAIDLRDVAPTLARVMGIELPSAEGSALPLIPATDSRPASTPGA